MSQFTSLVRSLILLHRNVFGILFFVFVHLASLANVLSFCFAYFSRLISAPFFFFLMIFSLTPFHFPPVVFIKVPQNMPAYSFNAFLFPRFSMFTLQLVFWAAIKSSGRSLDKLEFHFSIPL